jgi:replicative DNA helicase
MTPREPRGRVIKLPTTGKREDGLRNLTFERHVLGWCLLYGERDKTPMLPVQSEWQRESHGVIAAEVNRRRLRGEGFTAADILATCSSEWVESAGGHSYVEGLLNDAAPSSQALPYYLREIGQLARLRTLRGALRGALEACDERDEPRAVSTITQALRSPMEGRQRSIAEIVIAAREMADAAFQARLDGRPAGIPSPWPQIGRWAPLSSGRLMLIAARTGQGKTMLAAQAVHAALSVGHRVRVYSLEVPAEEWAARVAAHECRLSSTAWLKGELSGEQMDAFDVAMRRVAEMPLDIVDTPAMPLADIAVDLEIATTMAHVELFVVDHVGLIGKPAGARDLARHEMIGDAADTAKALAKRHRCAAICLVQINRAGAEGEPDVHHLADSGRVEQAADYILLAHRPALIDPSAEGDDLIVRIGKNRHGPTGVRMKLGVQWETGIAYEIDDRYDDNGSPRPAARASDWKTRPRRERHERPRPTPLHDL